MDETIKALEDLIESQKERKRRYAAEAARDEAQATATEANHKYYEAATELEKEKGKNIKLRAQLNHDYENSSIPSSKSIKRKKITNSRERTGRKPGAQPGHAHHPRKKQIPTQIINLAPPSEITEDPDFRPTGKTIVKQLIGVHMVMDVTEYHAEVFRNAKTGELRHAAFPDGVVNDVNYDGTVKALLLYLNVECAVSIEKCLISCGRSCITAMSMTEKPHWMQKQFLNLKSGTMRFCRKPLMNTQMNLPATTTGMDTISTSDCVTKKTICSFFMTCEFRPRTMRRSAICGIIRENSFRRYHSAAIRASKTYARAKVCF